MTSEERREARYQRRVAKRRERRLALSKSCGDFEDVFSYIVASGAKLFRCLQAHTSQEGWEPENADSLWKEVGDPTAEWPEWSQPIGSMDTYAIGDKVSHNGKHWKSTVENNVWEPGVYGWEEVTE